MKSTRATLVAILAGVTVEMQTLAEPHDIVAPELLDRTFLYETARHLYRWYMDELDIEKTAIDEDILIGVRLLKPAMDPDDQSQFGEILLPQFGISVKVKRPRYEIPELKLAVSSATFRITGVARGADRSTNGFTEVKIRRADLRDYLFHTRRDAQFPDEALMKRLRLAVRAQLKKDFEQRQQSLPAGSQTVYVSPLSPVANELWVFWENGHRLIRFSSDIDLVNPAVWELEHLNAKVFNLDDQVVVSLDEAPGSNTFMTRDQAGRALYNCVILGRRLEVDPPGSLAGAEGAADTSTRSE